MEANKGQPTEAEFQSMWKQLKESAMFYRPEIEKLSIEECKELFKILQNEMQIVNIQDPFGQYSIPFFTVDIATATQTRNEIKVLELEESQEILGKRGYHAAFVSPDQIYLQKQEVTPQSRIEKWLYGIKHAMLATEEEGLEHEIRHSIFQGIVWNVNALSVMDEAFAYATRSMSRVMNLAKTLRYVDNLSGSIDTFIDYHNLFLLCQAINIDERKLLSHMQDNEFWVSTRDLDAYYTDKRRILEQSYKFLNVTADQAAILVVEYKAKQRIEFLTWKYQVATVVTTFLNELPTKREDRKWERMVELYG